MDEATREMIKETIRTLKEYDKLSRLTRVEREAEIVRTIKQLESRPADEGAKKK